MQNYPLIITKYPSYLFHWVAKHPNGLYADSEDTL